MPIMLPGPIDARSQLDAPFQFDAPPAGQERFASILPSTQGPSEITEPAISNDSPFAAQRTDSTPPSAAPPGARNGVFQRFTLRETWLPRTGADGLGMNDVVTNIVLGFPLVGREWPLLLTPEFGFHSLDGPADVDVPPRLYDVSLEFRTLKQLTPRWGMDLAIAPSLFTDFENNSSEAFRLPGRGVALWNWTERTQVAMGVVYLGREGLSVLPVAGLIYTPHEDTRWEAIMPRPRVAHRFHHFQDLERWWYVAGELGGNTWAVEHDGVDDRLNYIDYRVVLGVEQKKLGGLRGRAEIGYVFGREIEFASGAPGADPNDTLMLRVEAGL